MSRGLGARGPERTEGADPAPPKSAPRARIPPPPPGVCTPRSQPGPPQPGSPLTQQAPPHGLEHGPSPSGSSFLCRDPLPSPQGALPLVSSEPRASRARRSSGSPSRPRRPPFSWTHPAPPPWAGRPRPRPGAGRPALGRRGPPPLRRDRARPPHPTAQRGRGRRSQAPAAFCSAWDGETPPRGPAGLVEVGEGVRGAASSRGPFVSLPVGRLPGAQRLGRGWPFREESVPTGFCLQPGVGPVALRGEGVRTARSPQKSRQGPVGTHSSAQGLRLGLFAL